MQKCKDLHCSVDNPRFKKFKGSNDLKERNSVNEFDIFATTRPMAHKAKGNF